MMLTPIEELIVAGHMRALTRMFEGDSGECSRIVYQGAIGFDVEQIGERCRYIDAADADGVFAIFDPDAIERGPAHIGICMRDRDTVRLDLGHLWLGRDPHAVLVIGKGTHLVVENGRFVERPGKPTADLTRGKARARRRLADLVSIRTGDGAFVVSMG